MHKIYIALGIISNLEIYLKCPEGHTHTHTVHSSSSSFCIKYLKEIWEEIPIRYQEMKFCIFIGHIYLRQKEQECIDKMKNILLKLTIK